MGGLLIGLTTEYHTSKIYSPVKELVTSCKTGAATNMCAIHNTYTYVMNECMYVWLCVCSIYGLSLGYQSVVLPVFILAFIIYVAFEKCDLYGVACENITLYIYIHITKHT